MSTSPATLPRWAWLVPGLLAALLYLPSLRNQFPYDDPLIVRDSWFLRDPGNVVHLVTPKYFRSGENSWRPAATASHLLEMQLVGAPPVPAANLAEARAAQPVPWDSVPDPPPAWFFHFNNLLLHVGVCVLLALCAAQWAPTAARGPTALLAGVLMAVHPAATEAICVISFREDVLAGGGMLLAMWCLHPARVRRRGWLAAGWAGAAVAIFAKESAILLPLLLLVADRLAPSPCTPPDGAATATPTTTPTTTTNATDTPVSESAPSRSRAFVYGPVFALGAIYLLGRLVLLRSPMEPIYAGLAPALEYRLLAIPALWIAHCVQLVLPVSLNADHFVPPVVGLGDVRFWFGGVLLAGAGLAWWRAWRTRWMPGVLGGLLIFMTWAPVSGVLPLPNPFAERYLYVEIIGVAWIAGAAGGAWWLRLGGNRLPFALAAVVLVGLLGVRTAVRIPQWYDSDTIWAATRASGAQTMRGYANRTAIAETSRDWDGWAAAAREWKTWADQWPAGAGPWHFSATLSLGQAYRRKAFDQLESGADASASLAEAERWLTAAQAQHPAHPLTNEELGVLERIRNHPVESERWFRAAIQAGRPNNARQRTALAELLVESGRLDEGIAELRTALDLDPGTHFLTISLASRLISRADAASAGGLAAAARSPDGIEAAALWRRATVLNPWDVDSRYNLGLFHLARQEPAQAAEPLLQAWTLERYDERYRNAARQALQQWSATAPGDAALAELLAAYGRP